MNNTPLEELQALVDNGWQVTVYRWPAGSYFVEVSNGMEGEENTVWTNEIVGEGTTLLAALKDLYTQINR